MVRAKRRISGFGPVNRRLRSPFPRGDGELPLLNPFKGAILSRNRRESGECPTKIVRLLEDKVEIKAGTQRPAPNSNEVAVSLAARAANIGLKTIVFVQQAGYAPSTAQRLASLLPGAERLTAVEQGYVDDIALELGGINRSLVTSTAGAVPHNGDMLPLERRLAESLFRRADGINVIVATPTLAQGINLPTQLAVLAGDKRQDERGREDLKAHEI